MFQIQTFDKNDLLNPEFLQKLDFEDGTEFQTIPGTNLARVVEAKNVTCTKVGQVCKDCLEVYYCISLPGGKWINDLLEVCDPETPCLAAIGNCSSLVNPDCPATISGYKFKCYQTGIFPDPYDCTAYHMCTQLDPNGEADLVETTLKCSSGFAYNSLTAKCSIRIINGNCSTISPSCSKLGETGPDPQNPSLYYVCFRVQDDVTGEYGTFPVIFSCPDDQVFDGVSSCTNPTTTVPTTSVPTTSVPTTSVPTTSVPTPTIDYGLTADGKCKKTGYFPLMNDCIGFNYCYYANYPPQRKNCVYKMYFDPKQQLCVDFKCSDLNRIQRDFMVFLVYSGILSRKCASFSAVPTIDIQRWIPIIDFLFGPRFTSAVIFLMAFFPSGLLTLFQFLLTFCYFCKV